MRKIILCLLYLVAASALADEVQVGMATLSALGDAGPVTVFYPTREAAKRQRLGPFELEFAADAPPVRGNSRLVVISPGSGAPPWVYFDVAKQLVGDGFVVAMPRHFRDNDEDGSEPGPASWKRRPVEVGQAIDRVGADPRFSVLLDLSRVGMYGMSAGGHTALALAGGRWSPGVLRRHCEMHAADDFQACAGPGVKLTGGVFDGLKIALVKWIDGVKLNDGSWYGHVDPRIAAVVAGVPFAADFDPASLSEPRVPLGIISARKDKWLVPAFHSDAILKACVPCERLADIGDGGHGALLSPLPPNRSGVLAELIADPPGFDRAAAIPQIDRKISEFFKRHLL